MRALSLAAWLLSTAALPGLAWAQDLVPVAVTDIDSLGGVEADQLAAPNARLAAEIKQLGRYQVLEMAGIRAALQIKGQPIPERCSDDDCLARLGKALGVRWITGGSLLRFGGTFVLKLRIVDAQSAQVAASATNQVKGDQQALLDALPQAVGGLFAGAASKLHPDGKATRPKAQRSQADQASVDEFERMLKSVESDKVEKDQIARAWLLVYKMASDPQLPVEVRRHALAKFLKKYRKNNPFYRQAYEQYTELEPASLEIRTLPAGALLTIDGTAVGSAPLRREVPAGSYRVVASLAGYQPSAQEVVVTRGQSASVSLLLMREVSEHPYSTWGHATFWSGLGLAGFGGLSMGLSVKYANDYESSGARTDADSSDTWATMMWVGFGAGAALLTTGIALWLLEPTAGERIDPATAGLAPTPDGQGLSLSLGGRW